MTKELSFQNFTEQLNTRFCIQYGGESPLEVELIEIKNLETAQAEGDRIPFSLIFRSGDSDRYLIQQIYEFEHAQMGNFELFLVPLGPDELGMRYEVIFS